MDRRVTEMERKGKRVKEGRSEELKRGREKGSRRERRCAG